MEKQAGCKQKVSLRYRIDMKIVIFVMAIIIAACSGSRETVKKDEGVSQGTYDESFDPLSLNDNDIVILPEEGGTADQNNSADDSGTSSGRISEVNGFRVQILATNNLEKASLVEQEAAERFSRDGHETYLVFEAPLYKIRIGDCTERQNAEAIRDLAKTFGYNGAFIVKSKVVSAQ
jgi:hypothetical protein